MARDDIAQLLSEAAATTDPYYPAHDAKGKVKSPPPRKNSRFHWSKDMMHLIDAETGKIYRPVQKEDGSMDVEEVQ